MAEKLLTHHVGGVWRAPLSQRMRNVTIQDGPATLRLVEADRQDIDRAFGLARLPDSAPEIAARLAAAWRVRGSDLARGQHPDSAATPPRPGPMRGLPMGVVVLLGSVRAPVGMLAAAAIAALGQGCAVILKPAPRAPFEGLALADAVSDAALPPGCFTLLQGGGAVTGQALCRHEGCAGAFLPGRVPRPELCGVKPLI